MHSTNDPERIKLPDKLDKTFKIKFHSGRKENKAPSVVYMIPLFSKAECEKIIRAAENRAKVDGWTHRGVALHTSDVVVSSLDQHVKNLIQSRLKNIVHPFINARFDVETQPRDGNLFIVKYCVDGVNDSRESLSPTSNSSTQECRDNLALHDDGEVVTVNTSLCAMTCYAGGGTAFEALGPMTTQSSPLESNKNGFIITAPQGYTLIHDGALRHAGRAITNGKRYIVVAFYDRVRDKEPQASEDSNVIVKFWPNLETFHQRCSLYEKK